MDTMMDSADARQILKDFLQNSASSQEKKSMKGLRSLIWAERVLHLKIVINQEGDGRMRCLACQKQVK